MAMKVYVPANGIREMPVLYLMHGRSGDENMMNVLDIQSAADKMIATGAIQPMVIVCPRMDDALGLDAYESYFFDEIIPLIEKRYHTGVRHIGGFSAGGYIALRYALLHPDMFAHVGGHMPAIDEQLDDEDLHYFGTHEKWAAVHLLSVRITIPSTTQRRLQPRCRHLADVVAVRAAVAAVAWVWEWV